MVTKWLERESSEVEENWYETPSTSTGTGRIQFMDTETPQIGKENENPNARMAQKHHNQQFCYYQKIAANQEIEETRN